MTSAGAPTSGLVDRIMTGLERIGNALGVREAARDLLPPDAAAALERRYSWLRPEDPTTAPSFPTVANVARTVAGTVAGWAGLSTRAGFYTHSYNSLRQVVQVSREEFEGIVRDVERELGDTLTGREVVPTPSTVAWDAIAPPEHFALSLTDDATPAERSRREAQKRALKRAVTALKTLELARQLEPSPSAQESPAVFTPGGRLLTPARPRTADRDDLRAALTRPYETGILGEGFSFCLLGVNAFPIESVDMRAQIAARTLRDALSPHVMHTADSQTLRAIYDRTAKLLEGVAIYNWVKNLVETSDSHLLPDYKTVLAELAARDPNTRSDPVLLGKALRRATVEKIGDCTHLWAPYRLFLQGFISVVFWVGDKFFTHAFGLVYRQLDRMLNLPPAERLSRKPLDILAGACRAVCRGRLVYAENSGQLGVENVEAETVAYINSRQFLRTHDSLEAFHRDFAVRAVQAVLPIFSALTDGLTKCRNAIDNLVSSVSSRYRKLGILLSILTTPLFILIWCGDKLARPIQWIINKMHTTFLLMMVRKTPVSDLFANIHNSFISPQGLSPPLMNALADLLLQLIQTLTPGQGQGASSNGASLIAVDLIPPDIVRASEACLKDLLLALEMQRHTDRRSIRRADQGQTDSTLDVLLGSLLRRVSIPGNPTDRNELIVGAAKNLWAQLFYLLSTDRTLALRATRLGLEAINSSLDSTTSFTSARPDIPGLVRRVVSAAVQTFCEARNREGDLAPLAAHVAFMHSLTPPPCRNAPPPTLDVQQPPAPPGVLGILNHWRNLVMRLEGPLEGTTDPLSAEEVYADVEAMGVQMLQLVTDLSNTLATLQLPSALVRNYARILSPFRTRLEGLTMSYIRLLDAAAFSCESPEVRRRVLSQLVPAAGATDETRSIAIRLEAIKVCVANLRQQPERARTSIQIDDLQALLLDATQEFETLLRRRHTRHVQLDTFTRNLISFLHCTLKDSLKMINSYRNALRAHAAINGLIPTRRNPYTRELQLHINALFTATGDSEFATQHGMIEQANAIAHGRDDEASREAFEILQRQLNTHMEQQKLSFTTTLGNLDRATSSYIELCGDLYAARGRRDDLIARDDGMTSFNPEFLEGIKAEITTLYELASRVEAPYPAYIDPSRIPFVSEVTPQVVEPLAQALVEDVQRLLGRHGLPEALTTIVSQALLQELPPPR